MSGKFVSIFFFAGGAVLTGCWEEARMGSQTPEPVGMVPEPPPALARAPEELPVPAPGRLLVSVKGGVQTAVAHPHYSPPPWPTGNCRTLYMVSPEGYARAIGKGGFRPDIYEAHVANLHAENLEEIVKRLNLDSIEVEYVGSRTCFIVDPRIPREWLRSDFCTGCVPEKIQELCRGKYASMFREKSLGE